MPQVIESKTVVEVQYPSSSFTFKKLEAMNTDVPSQTLRGRLCKAVKSGEVKKLEDVVGGEKRGRPQSVYMVN